MTKQSTSPCASLPYKTRLTGFCICTAIGVFCAIGSVFLMLKPSHFFVVSLFGQMNLFGALFFMVGLRKLGKSITKPHRLVNLVLYVAATAASVYLIFFLSRKVRGRRLAIMAAVAVQTCALLWISLSYVPFAKRIVGRCCRCRSPTGTGLLVS
ncbi:Vesicle transport protein [Plasmodiophora brassicae]|uniref:Vesicle transport protein n=1 Tax=Plasmodiophora brassicae TaxID=37360 RepID=A0A0G4J0M2_PLABS|nr:hypothetical protein PBRA_008216 [Plasmodiophora brassicae]SPR01212.1 unnamed protein product [Plasmodiophora brassicae]